VTHRKTEKERQLFDGKREGWGGRAKPYDSEKAWSSIYKSLNTLCPKGYYGGLNMISSRCLSFHVIRHVLNECAGLRNKQK
jgi:hypothetical protein